MKRITLMAAAIALFMLTAFALRLYLQTETRTGLELARFMPRGAIAYDEFCDLHSLLNHWLSSAAHRRYFQSANRQQFQRSRLYLRLNQRLDPIEAARVKNRLSVFFNRALLTKLGQRDGSNQQEFEEALGGISLHGISFEGPGHLQWKVAGMVHSLKQGMLDTGGAYATEGDALILANRADYCRGVVRAYQESEAPAERPTASLERFAQARVRQGKASYTHLMEMLAVPKLTVGSNLVIDLFSDNIASVLQVVP